MEIEFKFCIPADKLSSVLTAVHSQASSPVRMQARYFDTADQALARRGIALRLRQEGDIWIQTVKAQGDGPLQRLEHNVALSDEDIATLAPLASRHHGTDAGARLQQALAASPHPLQQTYGTDIHRTVQMLSASSADACDAGTVVELALDQGHITAFGGTEHQRFVAVSELELEWVSGSLAGLGSLAGEWTQQHGLYLSTISKAERGERLMADRWSRPAVASAAPADLQAQLALQHGASTLARPAFARLITQCLRPLLANASEIAEGADVVPRAGQAPVDTQAHVAQCLLALHWLQQLVRAWPLQFADATPTAQQSQQHEQPIQRWQQALTAAQHALAQPPADGKQPVALHAALHIRSPALQCCLIEVMTWAAQAHTSV